LAQALLRFALVVFVSEFRFHQLVELFTVQFGCLVFVLDVVSDSLNFLWVKLDIPI